MITLDSREHLYVRDALASALGEEEIKTAALPTADIVFKDRCDHAVGIERKTFGDFLSSFASGRLGNQLTRLRQEFDVPILIVEGSYGLDQNHRIRLVGGHQTGWYHGSVQAALFSLQGSGIYVLHVAGTPAFADTIKVLYKRGASKCLTRPDPSAVEEAAAREGLAGCLDREGDRVLPGRQRLLAKPRGYSSARGDGVGVEAPRYTLRGPAVQPKPNRPERLPQETPVHGT